MAGGRGGEGAEEIPLNTSVSHSSDPRRKGFVFLGKSLLHRVTITHPDTTSANPMPEVCSLGIWGILSWGCSVLGEPLWVQSFSAQVCCSGAYCRHQMSHPDKKKKKKQLSSHLFVCLTPPWVPNLQIVTKTLCDLKAFSLGSLPSHFMVMFELVFAPWM